MGDVFDRYYHRDNIPERLKKKLSIQDMREIAKPLSDEIERLQDTVTMLRNDLQNLRGRFLPGSFEQKMIDDALKYSKREALRDE